MKQTVLGSVLLTLGLTIIAVGVFSVYSVFTGRATPFTLFNVPGIYLDLTNVVGSDLSPAQRQEMQGSSNLKTELVNPAVINDPLNVFAHILFMGFLVNVGAKVAGLGVQFLRPIKVNLKEDNS